MDVSDNGFLCFAQEGDGSQFAVCAKNGRIYHVHVADKPEVILEVNDSWDTLADFLRWTLREMERA